MGGEFQIQRFSRSFYLDPILPLEKYERDHLRGAEVTTLQHAAVAPSQP